MSSHESVLQFWRNLVGEIPEPEKLACLSSLNEISPAVVAAARRLGNVRSATGFISSYLQPERQRFVEPFVHDVVFGHADPAAWKRGRTLAPDWSFEDQITLPSATLVAPAGGNGFSSRIVPELSSWQTGVSWTGAPCLPQPEADYLTPVPRNAVAVAAPRIEPVEDAVVAIRRWIATRIAAVSAKVSGTDFSKAESTIATLVSRSRWSHDTLAALAGLARESRDLAQNASAPPGFRGPGDWYRDA